MPDASATLAEITVADLGLDHANCSYSTGICEFLTAGQGTLDGCGYFSIPCPECAETMEARISRPTPLQMLALPAVEAPF